MPKLAHDFRDRGLYVRLFGGDVYAVGGFVRDILRRKPSEEVDLLVARRPLDEIVRILEPKGKVDLVGKSFGVIKFTRAGRTVDIALPRTDRAPAKTVRGHKDIRAQSDPMLPVEEDLRRRDFRCNSLAWRLSDGALIDPFDGRRDIREKILRLTNSSAFPEDPLRILRAARFASVLGFEIDPEIYPVARTVDLSGLSVERVTEELYKILLCSPRPSRGLEELFRLGALRPLLPELYALTLVIQDSVFHPEKDDFGHHTVWAHTKITVDQAKRLAEKLGIDPAKRPALLWAALFHDAGKAETTHWEYKRGRMAVTSAGHDTAGERLALRAFDRLKIYSWNGADVRELALRLIRTHHRAAELWQNREVLTKKAFNRFAADTAGEFELAAVLDAADRAGRSDRPAAGLDREARWLLQAMRDQNVSKETIRPLVLGRDLLKLNVAPGPAMGKLLKELYGRQLDGEFDTRAGALNAARRLVRTEHPAKERS
ncbi:MAG: HD domain-containing protein [Candidatus Aminicenantes bacterium]|nr:HD domain-containing protein [Candidatus Aminicenantes bacterium]